MFDFSGQSRVCNGGDAARLIIVASDSIISKSFCKTYQYFPIYLFTGTKSAELVGFVGHLVDFWIISKRFEALYCVEPPDVGVTHATQRKLLYFIVDYVNFETSSSSPYQIRRIEELNKVSSCLCVFCPCGCLEGFEGHFSSI